MLAPVSIAALLLLQAGAPSPSPSPAPPLAPLVARPASELAPVVDRFTIDRTALTRRYDADDSPARRRRMREFYTAWRARLREVEFDKLGAEGRVDYVLLDRYLRHQLALLDRRDKMRVEEAPLLPFADRLLALQDARRNLETIDPRAAARTLAETSRLVDSLRALFDSAGRVRASAPKVTRTMANRAADDVDDVRGVLSSWFRYYDGYDPMFSWWVSDPCQKLDEALTRYARTLRERVVGAKQTGEGGRGTGDG